MSYNDIQELLKLVHKLKFSEFKMKDGEFELSVRTKEYSKARMQSAASGNAPSIIPMPSPVAAVPQASFAPQVAAPAATPSEAEAPAAASAEKTATSEAAPAAAGNYLEIRSPIVGTFYRSASPDKPPYIKVGDSVKEGQTVCIVEAMKLFNEIESEVSGTIVKVLIEDATPVEYDQVLFLVEA